MDRMSVSRRKFAMRQELTSTLNARLERRCHDEWIDSQKGLNVVVGLVSEKNPSMRHIKVIQNFHGELDVSRFLDALDGSEVQTVAFVGVNMDKNYSVKLAKAVSDLNSAITCLQLSRIVPEGLPSICPAIVQSRALKELRLTFDHDLSYADVQMLVESVGDNRTLEIFKLYCVDLRERGASIMAQAIRKSASLKDIRLTNCHLSEITCLTNAIREKQYTRVDFSMNRISNTAALATLWGCPTIQYLSMSQNEIGSEEILEENRETYKNYFDLLATNKTLTNLHLDMNPMSPDFVEYLQRALEKNTTLTRLGLLSLTVTREAAKRIRYLVSLNAAGRGRVQRDFPAALLPFLLSRVSKEPDLLYGLMIQTPHVWL